MTDFDPLGAAKDLEAMADQLEGLHQEYALAIRYFGLERAVKDVRGAVTRLRRLSDKSA